MARSSEQVTQNEINSYKSFCDKQRIIHDGSQDDQHNADFIFNYFVNVWKQDITEQNLNTAWEHIRPHLKFKSAARAEFEKITSAAPDRARQLDQWLQAHGGKPGQLTNTPGDDTFENLTLLLGTLQGYEISTPRIQDAIDRIQNRPGRKLHYIEAPRKTQPTSRAALEDDGTPFVTQGLTLQRDGSLGKSPADYAREARQRSDRDVEAANQQRTGASAQSAAIREAKNKAEGLRGNTHSESEQIQRIFVTTPGTSDINWPDTLAARQNLQRGLNKAQETRRFIR